MLCPPRPYSLRQVLQQVQAQLTAAEALRPQLKEAQEALEESAVAHAAAMGAAAEAAAAEAAETMDDLLEASQVT